MWNLAQLLNAIIAQKHFVWAVYAYVRVFDPIIYRTEWRLCITGFWRIAKTLWVYFWSAMISKSTLQIRYHLTADTTHVLQLIPSRIFHVPCYIYGVDHQISSVVEPCQFVVISRHSLAQSCHCIVKTMSFYMWSSRQIMKYTVISCHSIVSLHLFCSQNQVI